MSDFEAVLKKMKQQRVLDNVSPKLHTIFLDMLKSAVELYGKYIDYDALFEKLKIFPILAATPKTSPILRAQPWFAGKFGASYIENETKAGFEGRLDINVAQKTEPIERIFAHEFAHYLSFCLRLDSPYKNKMIPANNPSQKFQRCGLYLVSTDNKFEIGRGIDEGMTELVAANIFNHCGKYGKYIIDVDFKFLYQMAKVLHGTVGEKAIRAYFSGDVSILAEEFERVLGKGYWEAFNRSLDRYEEALTLNPGLIHARHLTIAIDSQIDIRRPRQQCLRILEKYQRKKKELDKQRKIQNNYTRGTVFPSSRFVRNYSAMGLAR